MADNEKDVPIKEQEDGSILAKLELPEEVDEPVNEEVKETKKPDWYNPHATVYKLLDKRRESAPRPKSKNIYGNIGSSFSMMEFA